MDRLVVVRGGGECTYQMLAGPPPENQMNPVLQLQHQLNTGHPAHRSPSPGGQNRPMSPPQMMYSPQYQQSGLPPQYQGQIPQQQQQYVHGNQGYHPGYYTGGGVQQQFGYHQQYGSPIHGSPVHSSPVHSPHSPHSPSAAASFFARAAQKLNISSKKKKRHHPEPEPPPYPTQFNDVIRLTPPPAPPGLIRGVGRVQAAPVGKVKVLLRICQDPNVPSEGHSFINIDPRKKQVTLHDPSTFDAYTAPSQRRGGVSAPKMFAFDAVFSPDDSLTELCASGITEIIQAVVNGSDGCLFCYGHAKLGKTYTMIGHDDGPQSLGVIPCAIVWLFRLINEQKEKTGARFSVRVSAVEVASKQENLKDLLADVATGQEAGVGTSPGVYLREDPISGTQLENQSELRAPTAEKAAYYLDAAIASRTVTDTDDDTKFSHLLFTLHVYQYRVEKSGKGADRVSGGRSRLHLIDLGSCGKSRETGAAALTLSALGNVILSLLNGQRHIPHRDSKLSQLLRDSLGNLSCRTCMVAQVSPLIPHYNETLQVIQLAARIHRMRRRRAKWSGSASSDDSSSCASDESHRLRRPMRPRMGILREGVAYSSAISSHSDPEYTSSSEQSCDTVIYMGRNGQSLSDRELTDNEGPPMAVPVMPRTQLRYSPKPSSRCSSRASSRGSNRSSEDEGSMSDRSEGRTPKMGTTSIRRKTTSQSEPQGRVMSPPPQPGSNVVHLPRKSKKETAASLKFGPRSRSRDLSQELWIDGPGAAAAEDAPPSAEQWVDGPPEFLSDQEQAPSSAERWIDGPPEMVSKSRHKAQKHVVPVEVYSDDTPEVSLVDRYHQNIARAQAMKEKQAKEQVLVEAREKLIAEQKERERIEREEQMRAESEQKTPVADDPRMYDLNAENNNAAESVYQVLESSGTLKRGKTEGQSVHEGREGRAERPTSLVSVESLKAHKPLSRPISTHEQCDSQQDKQNAEDNPDSYMQVKPFVRDWVEKHSVMSSTKSAKCAEADQHMDSKINYENIIHHKQRSSRESSPMHRDEKAHPDQSTTSKSKHDIKKRLKKQSLPPAVNTNSRVAEWVQSVASTTTSQDVVLVDDACYHHSLPHRSKHEHTADFHTSRRTDSPQRSKNKSTSRSDKRHHYSDNNKVPSSHTESITDDNQLTIDRKSEFDGNQQSLYERTADDELETGDPVDNSINALKEDIVSEPSYYSNKRSQELDYTSEYISSNLKLTEEIHIDTVQSGANCELSPLLSDDSQITGRKIVRPSCLRRPDGASNPNLNKMYEEGEETESHPLLMSPSKYSHVTASAAQTVTVARAVEETVESKITKVKTRPPLPASCKPSSKTVSNSKSESSKVKKSSPITKSGLPIFGSGKGRANSSSPAPSAKKDAAYTKLPQRSASASPVSSHSSGSNSKATASKTSKSQSVKSKLPVLPVSKTTKDSKKEVKEKKDSKDKSKDPKLKESKNKDVTKASKKDVKEVKTKDTKVKDSKESKSSPLKTSIRGSPLFRRNKDKDKEKEKEKKEQKDKTGKDKGKDKKNKDTKLPVSKLSNNRVSELAGQTMLKQESDRDSGNDSAVPESKLLSPYSAMTLPRNSMHSSSGHGSDNSSVFSAQVFSKHMSKLEQRQGGMSSGYESMLRDSEATGSNDSTSEGSTSEKIQGTKLLRKKSSSTRRSRSAPARTPESPSVSCINSPLSCRKAYSPSPKAWVDTRQLAYYSDEPLELKKYNMDDVDRMHRRRLEEIQQKQIRELRYKKISQQIMKQAELKDELYRAKDRLMIEQETWSFDLHVAEQLDWDDPNYLEALEKETSILEKRVDACKSHIMMVTCFDVGMSC